MTLTLRHKDLLSDNEMVHFTRSVLSTARPSPLHTHDFFELFWVQNGLVRHHLPDGVAQLSEGACVLLEPGQLHGLQAKTNDALVVSICIHPDIIHNLRSRHSASLPHSRAPLQWFLESRDLAPLNQAALKLERSDRSVLATEAFLLPVLCGIQEKFSECDAPQWLKDAMAQAAQPDVFRKGSAGLVELTGRSHAHVSRSMRQFTGQSPSEFINQIRMTFAARQLVTDSEPVQVIASECGIPNMAHFHKLFRLAYAMTPLKYRQKYQRNVVQPK